MITFIQDYIDSSIPKAKACIIGAGAAGIEIATQLASSFGSILLLEAGLEEFDFETQKLTYFKQQGKKIRSLDPQNPFTFEMSKKGQTHLKQYGGTLNIWGGKWKTLDPIDFESRFDLSETAWPITYQDLYSYYASIAQDYQILDLTWANAHNADLPFTISQLPGFSPSLDLLEKHPTNSKHKFQKQLASSSIQVILGAHVVNIALSENLDSVKHLHVRSLRGQDWYVEAQFYILAAGSIENAKLLLNSRSQLKKGVGNHSDWVGRNLLDHPKGFGGLLFPYDQNDIIEGRTFSDKNKTLEIGISLNQELLKKERLPNHCINIFPRIDQNQIVYAIKFYLEQLPNANSHLFLTNEKDVLNQNIVSLDWKFRKEDLICFENYLTIFANLLKKHQVGELNMKADALTMEIFRDASHQLGTTRMALKAQDGVVDTNCQVFGVNNLFIAGSSIFPTAGHANPTLTILALARRLADHLKRTYGNIFFNS
ncbi:GMC oxidoreductase [Candidatus Protochlamydia sp. R18]|uniref:GMC oxidoreductase n=1 Tax=Candidatus Protochlamydia sp. R18 TaxID=1353977 RepID=UPI0005AABCE2|nr:GMC family oxidoreductase [Candidatus Protochlamydia sp. R18]